MKILCAVLLLIIAGLAIALHITMKKLKQAKEMLVECSVIMKTVGEQLVKISTALSYKNVGGNADVENSDIKEEENNE